ncbi:MAG: primosomal protein N' [Clostridiales bacterium]|nr:primosomal protein N' [Clostridiales bacterium]
MDVRVIKVGVRILDAPYQIDREYSYYSYDESIAPGDFVLVPFGKANKRKTALVTSVCECEDYSALKPVDSKIDENLSLKKEFMGLWEFMREQTFCSCGDAVRRFIPAAAFDSAEETLVFVKEPEEEFNERVKTVLSYIRLHSPVKTSKLEKEYGEDCKNAISKLVAAGCIEKDTVIKEAKGSTNKIASVREDADESELSRARTPAAYKEIYNLLLSEENGISVKELEEQGFKRAHITALQKRGLINITERETIRNHYDNFEGGGKLPSLSAEQNAAYEKLSALIDDGAPHGALLYGVTGSGKTSVMLNLCKRTVDSGKTAIVLVPEIGLTWQSVSVFAAIFGKRLAIIHSSLSDGERYDSYKRIKRGEVDIVLGTRSAIFAPLENLGLIVIDEEQEHTYKSDITPKYHARDIARFRAAENGALMLLCSATPSVESFYKAKSGIYELVTLKNRYGSAVLPDVIVADMREGENPTEVGYIGARLEEELCENEKNGFQSMLFLNRRGYNSYVICRACGEVIVCPKCSVSLTYHKTRTGGALVCHYCGHREVPPHLCPKCASAHISYGGYGTQLIEDELKEKLPRTTVARMDADSTKGKFSQDDIVESFAKGESDVLVGTQMLAKGHNFPKVTLVGVINADNSLFMDDFRANERTFSLITQVVGRAGRGEQKGRAVIQTMNPYNETIRLAAAQDYDAFYEDEIALRKTLVFPPFCDITTVTFASEEEAPLCELSEKFLSSLKKLQSTSYPDVPFMVFGPFDMPIYKIKNKFRRRMVIKHKNNKRFRLMMAELYGEYLKKSRDIMSISIDINPTIT